MTSVLFADLGLAEPILDALKAEKHETPTPIQAQAIPEVLAGRDILGLAQTGTGKTAAFALPILHRLQDMPRQLAPKTAHVLILAPTRELAIQIGERAQAYGKNMRLKQAIILGGVSQYKQVQTLARGVDILIATPGRLLDLVNQRHLRLDQTSILVLDEADRMFDMGFIVKVRQIVALLSQKRQTLMFSATMPPDISKLAHEILRDPVRVEVAAQQVTADRIEQSLYYVDLPDKKVLLTELLNKDPGMERVIAFTRTKYAADRIATFLCKAGIKAESLHGDKSQGARQRSLEMFRNGSVRVLVATDIAARGIDINNITHVVNFDLPNEAESYVHRIGRTARAGTAGQAISFCDGSERNLLRDIERLTKQRLNVVGGDVQSLTPMPPVGARKGAKPIPSGPAQADGRARRGSKPRALGQGNGQGRQRDGQDDFRPARRQEGRSESRSERSFESRSERRPEGGRPENRTDARAGAPRPPRRDFGDEAPRRDFGGENPRNRSSQGQGGNDVRKNDQRKPFNKKPSKGPHQSRPGAKAGALGGQRPPQRRRSSNQAA